MTSESLLRPEAPLLDPGRNCWRVETAHRAACIVDGEAYFSLAKQALLRARHSVLLLAWDFAERARLEPGEADPAEPDRIGDLLRALADRPDGPEIRVLVWSKAALLGLRRWRLPGAQARHLDGGRLRYVLDDRHPALACHHQKVLVVDDAVAFCGGFDFAANRWDTRAHLSDDPRRHRPSGSPYEPHHDLMMAVDGPAARALGELARDRLQRATGERLEPAPPGGDPWPEALRPDFKDVPVGIARTVPAWRDQTEVREVERLYADAIAAARETIYIENQYFASPVIAEMLARRLAEPHGPEIVIVNPKMAPSAAERVAMDSARSDNAGRLRAADRFNRFRLYAALTRGDAEVIVHSKVMVVDDRLLRIGSANLNNRSMGVDTECDLAIEAVPGTAEEAVVRQAIRRVRDALIAEQVGASAERLSRVIAEQKSMILAIERLNGSSSRRLMEFPPPRPDGAPNWPHQVLTDPLRPPLRPAREWLGFSPSALRPVGAVALGAALIGLAAAWWLDRRRHQRPFGRR
ncbi:phospholipase D-like domain-containing protein [Falsiroseomonas sp.]|uniref:phospholipase D-like domain-containing protein n=1 Tax=Falsiroseomonas sp. TaxID=2870721 RepID=UPI003561D002